MEQEELIELNGACGQIMCTHIINGEEEKVEVVAPTPTKKRKL